MGKHDELTKYIKIRGAREHNLKGIDIDIPRDEFVVLTGLSGSGKSSLAFDTIYAEGQRRYMESLSSYARMFLGRMEKPNVESIEGLSPAISIDQKSTNRNPRSTVGTVTEIYDYFRLLYARIGIPHCPKCGQEIKRQTVDQIGHTLDWLLQEYQSGSYGLVQKSSIKFIPVNEIMYVESSNTKCILHRTDGRTYHVYKKLNEIESELNDARFLRCHQSYLVNMNYVSEANDSFVLQNGDTVLIRAKSKRMILQKVLEYKEKTYRMRNYLSKHSMV